MPERQEGSKKAANARQRASAAKAADQRDDADHQIDQALHHAPGAGRHVEDVLGNEGDAHGAEREKGDQAEQAF